MNIHIFAYVEARVYQPSDEWKNKEITYSEVVGSLLFFVEFSNLIEVAFLTWKIPWEAAKFEKGALLSPFLSI